MEDLNQGVAPLREPRVASFMDDVEARAFTFWDSSNLNAVAADEIEPVSYNDAAEYMSEARNAVLLTGCRGWRTVLPRCWGTLGAGPASQAPPPWFRSQAGVQMLSLGKQLSGYPSAEKRKTAINKLATFVTDLPSPDRCACLCGVLALPLRRGRCTAVPSCHPCVMMEPVAAYVCTHAVCVVACILCTLTHAMRVLSVRRVTAMSLSDDLLSLAEFIEIFNEPIQLELDSDNVWPIPRSVAV